MKITDGNSHEDAVHALMFSKCRLLTLQVTTDSEMANFISFLDMTDMAMTISTCFRSRRAMDSAPYANA